MPRNLVALRQSPDWENFDLESSRTFLRRVGLDENLIIDFVAIWDVDFNIPYRAFRSLMKGLALRNHSLVRGAEQADAYELDPNGWDPADRVAFVDDDDWFSPALFEAVPNPISEDVIVWGNCRLGKAFSDPSSIDHQGIFNKRPIDGRIWTNNYAVSGKSVSTFGLPAITEHGGADVVFADRRSKQLRDDYLSCTVKHPCSTMFVKHYMRSPDFRRDPSRVVMGFVGEVMECQPDADLAWMAPDLEAFRTILAELKPR